MSADEGPLSTWTLDYVLTWLGQEGLGRWKSAFQQNNVDGATLAGLDDAGLKGVGIASGLQRKKILRLVSENGAASRRASQMIDTIALDKQLRADRKKKKKKKKPEIKFKDETMNKPPSPIKRKSSRQTAKARQRSSGVEPQMKVVTQNEEGRDPLQQLVKDLVGTYGDEQGLVDDSRFMKLLVDGGWEKALASRARMAFRKPGGESKLHKFFQTGMKMDPTKTNALMVTLRKKMADKKAKEEFQREITDQKLNPSHRQKDDYKLAADYHQDTHFDPDDPFKSYDWSRSVDLANTLNEVVLPAGSVNEAMEKYKEVFSFFDSDTNGVIDIQELTSALREIRGRHVTESEARATLRSMNFKSADHLQFEEFVRLLEVENMDMQKNEEDEKDRIRRRNDYMRKRRIGAGILDNDHLMNGERPGLGNRSSSVVTLDLDSMMDSLPDQVGELETQMEEATRNHDFEKCIALREKIKSVTDQLKENGPACFKWGPEQVAAWMCDHDMAKYSNAFQERKIDGMTLCTMTVENLTDIAGSRLQAKKIAREIDRLKHAQGSRAL